MEKLFNYFALVANGLLSASFFAEGNNHAGWGWALATVWTASYILQSRTAYEKERNYDVSYGFAKGFKKAYYRWIPVYFDKGTEEIKGRNLIYDAILDVAIWVDVNIVNVEDFPLWVEEDKP